MIPSVLVKPNLDDVQESLMIAGKTIAGVAKGVAQWDGGNKEAKSEKVKSEKLIISMKMTYHLKLTRIFDQCLIFH